MRLKPPHNKKKQQNSHYKTSVSETKNSDSENNMLKTQEISLSDTKGNYPLEFQYSKTKSKCIIYLQVFKRLEHAIRQRHPNVWITKGFPSHNNFSFLSPT
jgi:hypothetical protein